MIVARVHVCVCLRALMCVCMCVEHLSGLVLFFCHN
jgi:hypothetical protein